MNKDTYRAAMDRTMQDLAAQPGTAPDPNLSTNQPDPFIPSWAVPYTHLQREQVQRTADLAIRALTDLTYVESHLRDLYAHLTTAEDKVNSLCSTGHYALASGYGSGTLLGAVHALEILASLTHLDILPAVERVGAEHDD